MKNATMSGRIAVCLVLLTTASGCQLVKRLTGRDRNDAGTTRPSTTPLLSADAGAAPVIALPNPTVQPAAPQQMPAPTDAAAAAPADAGAAATDAAPAQAPAADAAVAVVDGGAVNTNVGGDRRHRGIDNFCKEHPGAIHPRTRLPCPI